jgi:hypothetical protein
MLLTSCNDQTLFKYQGAQESHHIFARTAAILVRFSELELIRRSGVTASFEISLQ